MFKLKSLLFFVISLLMMSSWAMAQTDTQNADSAEQAQSKDRSTGSMPTSPSTANPTVGAQINTNDETGSNGITTNSTGSTPSKNNPVTDEQSSSANDTNNSNKGKPVERPQKNMALQAEKQHIKAAMKKSQPADNQKTVGKNWDKTKTKFYDWHLKLGGQAVTLVDFRDNDSKPLGLTPKERVNFGVHRGSIMFMGTLFDFASLRAHLLAMPMSADQQVQLADLEIGLQFHHWLGLHGGRFKKAFTSQYTDYWGTWHFFDVSPAFKYAKGKLGLAGRGEGIALKGHSKNRNIKYMAGIFNGLEEHKPWFVGNKAFSRTDESLELVARIDFSPVQPLSFGAGFAMIPETTLTITTTPDDPTIEPTSAAIKQDLWAYAANITFKKWGLTIEPEFIGHVENPESGDAVAGGGVNVDILYDIGLPKGVLQPGFRYAVLLPDFDDTKKSTDSIIGSLYWKYNKHIKTGIEIAYLKQQPKDLQGVHGLFQLAVYH